MTNSWADLDNSTMFFVCGANPAENHPASMAHVNNARFDGLGRGRNAALVVVDPRQTRTARLINAGYNSANANDMRKYDRYVRIRPGTNIAFMNGVMNSIITWMYANPTNPASVNFFAWHNSTSATYRSLARAFVSDSGVQQTLDGTRLPGAEYSHDGGATWEAAPITTGWPKYCDSRIKVASAAAGSPQVQIKDDYQRAILRTTGYDASGNYMFSNMPVFAADVEDQDCVFQKLKAHVAKYPAATVTQICGCTEADITAVRDAFIANSRCSSSDCNVASATISAAGYRAATIMYAMGATQFTSGSQGIRSYAMIQTLMGNMGRAGGGIDALRGIHNVQGSTDMGNLFDLIPAYSGNPAVNQAYPAYVNALFGNRVNATTYNGFTPTVTKNPYVETEINWQQRGFYNMTREWFGSRAITAQADFDKLWACWPKGNGVQHVEAFRRMDPVWVAAQTTPPPQIKACVILGQNPAVTEPNQGAVRTGLEALDLLVVTDMFATETAQTKRKAGGATYLLPACSHVEEAGSVANSGRWLQWRDRATAPKGNSKADLELLHRLAKKLNDAGAFSHITDQWVGTTLAGSDAYDVLWAKYGWNGTGNFEDVTGVDFEGNTLVGSEYVAEQVFKEMSSPLDGYTAAGAPGFVGGHKGTMWIYSGNKAAGHGAAYDPDEVGTNLQPPAYELDASGVVTTTPILWDTANRAKSRKGAPKYAAAAMQYPRFGWAWLLNRRVMYNNGELPGDVADVFVAPGYLSRLWTIVGGNTLADWSWLYRAYNLLSDVPDVGTSTGNHVYPGRFPAFTEPYETPYDGTGTLPNLVAAWGRNTSSSPSLTGTTASTAGNLVPPSTSRGTAANFPLILTTIRCVEHFQGGPTTRNNPWNVEAEPDPWIELNPVDALANGIKDGDWVNVITARGNSTTDETARTIQTGALSAGTWNKGFKARVGVGTLANQRVAPGTVAIPWHWGDRGLGVGARANDLTIDAGDANTWIPESKACLCRIQKVTL